MAPNLPPFEKLGAFYLGKVYDLDSASRRDDLVLYDSKDLVTHAVCVGMTGSGKTGLCVSLIEEAAIDGVPAIVIDPKGDLSNLLLTFPGLTPAEFAPWVNPEDAAKENASLPDFAARQASTWSKGLAQWGQDAARVQRLKDAAEFRVLTPGSNTGLPVSMLRSFDVPARTIMDDSELLNERVSATAASLMGLMGRPTDGVLTREYVLISNILLSSWTSGRNLDIASLVQLIQNPPFAKLGLMELEAVYPAQDRFALAMSLNNLIASPGFAGWMEGEPLDVASLLYSPQGKPRVSIISISHLDESKRMFVVSILLNQVLGWIRTQTGTSSLRAILFMDEIAGYFPPIANPPSKQPLLTLMKQGRAFGLGVVLATQNPVDLDYKGLANAGTWFIGRLQTERDKAKVLDGLEGASANAAARFDRAACDRALSSLKSRVFLLNNVHEERPEVFETRWCLSYLRGPLTRDQLRRLCASVPTDNPPAAPPGNTTPPAFNASAQRPVAAQAPASPDPRPQVTSGRPMVPPDIPQYFIRTENQDAALYEPHLLGVATVYYSDAPTGIEVEVPAARLVALANGPVVVDWAKGVNTSLTESDLDPHPAPNAEFGALPPQACKLKSYETWKKGLADSIWRTHRLELVRSSELEICSRPGESQNDFRARLAMAVRERRDQAADLLRQKYGPKLAALQDRVRRAQQAAEVQQEQASAAKTSTLISFGAAVVGAFLGRKIVSSAGVGKAASAARAYSRQTKESADVTRAAENVESLRLQLTDLESRFRAELDAEHSRLEASMQQLEPLSLKPKKTNIVVKAVVLAWGPPAAPSE